MSKPRLVAVAFGLFFAVGLCGARAAHAQSILSNIPSTDTMPEGVKYVEFGFSTDFKPHREGGFQTYGVKTVYGVSRNVEVGVNMGFADAFAPNQPVSVTPNVKWRFLESEEKGVAASVGGMLFAPVAHRSGTDTYGMIYATASKKISARFGPRFTGGAYGLVGRSGASAGTNVGAVVGYEQPLHRRLTFVTDWYSGRNGFGYVTPGFIFSASKRTGGFAGYAVGNDGRNKNRLIVSYGVKF